MVSDAMSIDGIKKKLGEKARLIDFFKKQFTNKKSNYIYVI